jgi:hypothetical protein
VLTTQNTDRKEILKAYFRKICQQVGSGPEHTCIRQMFEVDDIQAPYEREKEEVR